MSAVGNHTRATCNLLTKYAGARKGTVVLGGLFTFLAIANSTTRAATQGRAPVGKNRKGGVALAGDDDLGEPVGHHAAGRGGLAAVPGGRRCCRGGRDALDEMGEAGEEDIAVGEERDDERTGTLYNVRRSSPV